MAIDYTKYKKNELIEIIKRLDLENDKLRTEKGYEYISMHWFVTGDDKVVSDIHRLLEVISSDEPTKRMVSGTTIGKYWGSNGRTYNIPNDIIPILESIIDRSLEIKTEAKKEGFEKGRNLLMQLNSGEVSPQDFYKGRP